MAIPIIFKRGPAASRTFTPADGEPVWDTDTDKLYIGNNVAAGGVEVSMGGHDHDADYVEIAGDKMTGDLEIEKASPTLTLDATSGDGLLDFHDAGASEAYIRYAPATTRLSIVNPTTTGGVHVDGKADVTMLVDGTTVAYCLSNKVVSNQKLGIGTGVNVDERLHVEDTTNTVYAKVETTHATGLKAGIKFTVANGANANEAEIYGGFGALAMLQDNTDANATGIFLTQTKNSVRGNTDDGLYSSAAFEVSNYNGASTDTLLTAYANKSIEHYGPLFRSQSAPTICWAATNAAKFYKAVGSNRYIVFQSNITNGTMVQLQFSFYNYGTSEVGTVSIAGYFTSTTFTSASFVVTGGKVDKFAPDNISAYKDGSGELAIVFDTTASVLSYGTITLTHAEITLGNSYTDEWNTWSVSEETSLASYTSLSGTVVKSQVFDSGGNGGLIYADPATSDTIGIGAAVTDTTKALQVFGAVQVEDAATGGTDVIIENTDTATGYSARLALRTSKTATPSDWSVVANGTTGKFTINDSENSLTPVKITQNAVDNLFRMGHNETDEVLVGGYISATNGHLYIYNGSSTSLGTSATVVALNTQGRVDDCFTHSTGTNPGEVTLDIAGDYDLTFDVAADSSDAATRRTMHWYAEYSTGTFAKITGTDAYSYHRNSVDGEDSATISFTHTCATASKVRVIGIAPVASTLTTIIGTCRCRIRRI